MDLPGELIAPLNFSKGDAHSPVNNASSQRAEANNKLVLGLNSQVQMTPPLTPHSSREEIVDRNGQERSVFHNFLRAFYPFQPNESVTSSSVTLPLDQGDVILVHSVHTNGWADGTLLDTGARGWLPTNYCEAYDQVAMRPLLKALTDFWDIIRGGCGNTLHQFANQDYMRGLIAGVRFLLEKSECLTRDCVLVQTFDGLRRNRKALLSDLSSLVKLAKRLQDVAKGGLPEQSIDDIFDQMLLKAFRIVTRSVRFLDVWNEEVGLRRAMAELERPTILSPSAYDAPLTPPADATFSPTDTCITISTSTFFNPTETPNLQEQQGEPRQATQGQSLDKPLPEVHSQNRPLSFQTKRMSVSHRISYTRPASVVRNPNLASERLGAAYDAFLGVLGSFIGLHLQSRSSTELILTTQQSVQSCRTLLSVVEAVWEHDLHRSELLERAKDAMYEKITELVHAARDAFRPANATDEEIVFMPDEGKRLVDAATECVRGAGDCVAKARHVLEQIGNFEFEPIGLGISTFDSNASTTADPRYTTLQDEPSYESKSNSTESFAEQSLRPPPPPLKIPDNQLFYTPSLTDGTTPSTQFSENTVQTPTSTTFDGPPSSTLSSFTDLNDALIPTGDDYYVQPLELDSPIKTNPDNIFHVESNRDTTTSTGSETTYVSNARDSEMSGVSQSSTRATTPDLNKPFPPLSTKSSFQGSQASIEEVDESGEGLLEKTFAHELMFKDGQVIGGSLRALIEKLTAHQSTPDALFVSTFYLTFRHFSCPTEFAEMLIDRYDYVGGVAGPVRLRVYNIFKGWLESHWRHDCDDVALPAILKFARTKLMITLPTAGKRLVDLAEKVSNHHGPVVPRLVSSMGKTNTSIASYVSHDVPLPVPIVSKSQLGLLKQWRTGGQAVSILDFDPLELARQLTIKESGIFCMILPEELLGTEWMKKTGSLAVNVRAMSTLSTDIANLVADCILHLEEPKKRAAIIKQWVKIGTKCLELNNYDTLMAIVCSLNSSTISRLKRTWELVSQKTKNALDHLREIVDVSRNYAVLRQRLQNHVPPCLPFVGTYLTDLTFVDHGNQNTRTLPTDEGSIAVINFDKHVKTAKIISELQRFQIPYRLVEVPELQTWIQDQLVRVRSAGETTFQKYYRRSLVLEPRDQAAQRPPPPPESTLPMFSRENAKEKFDFLAWTHSSKVKVVASHG
ncbi:hypothetical protein AJ80_02956 [Polytolypa hystricis UAMH7299]|uniref:Ras guanine-nucleotide exchange protein n=1 Tax=Polytolypa hystricis (strain UAMH7299) TaxID=1447883 RepID=A0A2B7YQI7_POLH7|nr:hypothetical protein AJ80_02956 [Polytolypa hystricis UAMH7299]